MPRSGPSDAAPTGAGSVFRRPGAARWLVLPLAWLFIGAAAFAVSFAGREWLPYVVGGILACGWLVWVLCSALSPAQPDRRCPRCRREALRRISPASALGIHCTGCGFEDEDDHRAYLLE